MITKILFRGHKETPNKCPVLGIPFRSHASDHPLLASAGPRRPTSFFTGQICLAWSVRHFFVWSFLFAFSAFSRPNKILAPLLQTFSPIWASRPSRSSRAQIFVSPHTSNLPASYLAKPRDYRGSNPFYRFFNF